MGTQVATINITNLRLRTLIGFNPDERVKKQDVVLNIQITYSVSDAALEDQVEHALTIDKPHALRFADSVSLTLAYSADRSGSVTLLEKAS